jgi:hypothetical protein
MKKNTFAVFILSLGIWIAGCSKPSDDSSPPPLLATLNFNANGILVNRDGSAPLGSSMQGSTIARYITTEPAIPSHYTLFSQTSATGLYAPLLALKMLTSNLTVGTYTLTTPLTVDWTLGNHVCFMPGSLLYTAYEAGDFATVNITSIHDGVYVDGNFSGLMSYETGGTIKKLTITNGQFRNIKIEP